MTNDASLPALNAIATEPTYKRESSGHSLHLLFKPASSRHERLATYFKNSICLGCKDTLNLSIIQIFIHLFISSLAVLHIWACKDTK